MHIGARMRLSVLSSIIALPIACTDSEPTPPRGCVLAADVDRLAIVSSGFDALGVVTLSNDGDASCDVQTSVTSDLGDAALPFLVLDPDDPSPGAFTVAPGATRQLGVLALVKLIGDGDYTGELRLESEGDPIAIPVALTVACLDDNLTDDDLALDLGGAPVTDLVLCRDDFDGFRFTSAEPVRFDVELTYRWDYGEQPLEYIVGDWFGPGQGVRCGFTTVEDPPGVPVATCRLAGAAYPGYAYRVQAFVADHGYVPSYRITSAATPLACETDPWEPDNLPEEADAAEPGHAYERRLCPFDVDQMTFETTAPARVRVQLRWLDGAAGGGYGVMAVYETIAGTGLVAFGIPSDTGEAVELDLPPGVHLLRIADADDRDRRYRVTVRLMSG